MIMFPTSTLFIEGCDLSGKTELIKKLHTTMDYKWHIYDRSQISRKAFNELYNRDIRNIKDDYNNEINNLNNRFVILVPTWKTIEKRFKKRGDEIHNILSLKDVYTKFEDVATSLSGLPNVFIPRYDQANIEDSVIMHLDAQEHSLSLSDISDQVFNAVTYSDELEIYSLSFMIYDDCQFEKADDTILTNEVEGEYYTKIMNSLLKKIDNELSGKNEYDRIESSKSRRFVYTDDSCISFIQVAVRDNVMDFHCVLRSSDVENTFQYDLKFLYFLASKCFDRLELESEEINKVRLRFNLNSAHTVQ